MVHSMEDVKRDRNGIEQQNDDAHSLDGGDTELHTGAAFVSIAWFIINHYSIDIISYH